MVAELMAEQKKSTKELLIEHSIKWGIGALFGFAALYMLWNMNDRQQVLFEKLVNGTVDTQQNLSESVGSLDRTVKELNDTVGESFSVSSRNQDAMTKTLGSLDDSIKVMGQCAEETKQFQRTVIEDHQQQAEDHRTQMQELKALGPNS